MSQPTPPIADPHSQANVPQQQTSLQQAQTAVPQAKGRRSPEAVALRRRFILVFFVLFVLLMTFRILAYQPRGTNATVIPPQTGQSR
jgi:hypothetical protein